MLNKDQYNKDVYNDYYAQATKGAEIKHGQKERGLGKLLLIFLLLALIGVLGYFVWENLTSVKDNKGTTKEEMVHKITEINNSNNEVAEDSLEEALAKTLQASEEQESSEEKIEKTEVTSKIVADIASQNSDTKMSPADIAKIVQLVTQQMQIEKETEEQKNAHLKTEKDSLEASLENVETDTLSSEAPIISTTDGSQKKEASIDKKTNTYNKVVVQDKNIPTETTDELSQLSMEISNVINSNSDTTPTDSNSYTSSLSQEADSRSKEMRYHIVQKGDTLAGIALKIYGNSRDYIKLYEANPDILRRADKIYIGQRLRVPE